MTDFSKFGFYWSLAGATDLTDTEFRVLVLLANYADGKTGKRAFPSAATLAEQIGKSPKTVRRALAALVAKGWLLKTDRPGATTEYQLVTLDTQMSRVTPDNPGHSDVQGPDPTLDISDPTLDTQVSTPPGHPDVHRSDQGSDPSRIRSVTDGSDQSGQDIPEGDVHPGHHQDETGLGIRSLAIEGTEAPRGADGRSPVGSSLEADSQPAIRQAAPQPSTAAPQGLVGLHPQTASSGLVDDPFASEPAWRAESRARNERAEQEPRPSTVGGPPAWS